MAPPVTNRIHARSTGAFGAGEPESIFLRYLLPGIRGTFAGDIDSKTLVNRFAVGVRSDALPQFSFGANLDYIDCRTETCGVHTNSNGYEARSVRATAVSYGISASYRPSDRLTLGVAWTDIDTELKVHRTVTDKRRNAERFLHHPVRAQARRRSRLPVQRHLAGHARGQARMGGTTANYSLGLPHPARRGGIHRLTGADPARRRLVAAPAGNLTGRIISISRSPSRQLRGWAGRAAMSASMRRSMRTR